ncbi:MAG: hypothetical protein ACOYBS_12660 [Flavobacterium sp.]
MKTYISDLIPKIQRYSQKLDNLTLLTNQHWVVIDELENSKLVYIFRSNSELLISKNGNIKKGKWEFLGNNSLLIEENENSFMFIHGFFDENILALKKDGLDDYSILINENKFEKELNSLENVISFLSNTYLKNTVLENLPKVVSHILPHTENKENQTFLIRYKTDVGELVIEQKFNRGSPETNERAFLNNEVAKDGKYKFGFLWYVHIKNGVVEKTTLN